MQSSLEISNIQSRSGSPVLWISDAIDQVAQSGIHHRSGAVAVVGSKVVAKAYNQIEKLKDATAHAEMLLITQVSSFLGDWRLGDVTIYVTKEPCPMCAGAMVNSRLGNLVYGIRDPKYGAAGTALDITNFQGTLHKVKVRGGILEEKCLEIFQSFFRDLRKES